MFDMRSPTGHGLDSSACPTGWRVRRSHAAGRPGYRPQLVVRHTIPGRESCSSADPLVSRAFGALTSVDASRYPHAAGLQVCSVSLGVPPSMKFRPVDDR